MEKEKLTAIVRQVFDLTKTEANIVLYLRKHKTSKFTIDDLTKVFSKNRTTITKAINKNRKYNNLIKQYQENLSRGFRFNYGFNKDVDLGVLLIRSVKVDLEKQINIINELL